MKNLDELLWKEYKKCYLLLRKRNLEEYEKTKDSKWLKEIEELDKVYQETIKTRSI